MNKIAFERDVRFNQLRSNGGDSFSLLLSSIFASNYTISQIDEYIQMAKSIKYNHAGLSQEVYLSHPFRVATLCIDEAPNPSIDLISTALLHNIKELSCESYFELSSSLPRTVFNGISVLTIDRAQLSQEYLSNYYDGIYQSDQFLRIVKVMDKLDNLFLLCLNNNADVRAKYLDEIRTFVLPMVEQDLPHLRDYFLSLLLDCETIGYFPL